MIVKRSSIPDIAPTAENRGKRETSSVGDANGSGAGAVGGDGPEDYDSDSQVGGGKFPAPSPPAAGDGADAPIHGSR